MKLWRANLRLSVKEKNEVFQAQPAKVTSDIWLNRLWFERSWNITQPSQQS